jgi:hypothetical protein
MNMDNTAFVNELAKLKPSATFLTIRGYRSDSSEVANYSLCFNISYRSALEKSIAKLEKLTLATDLEKQAHKEVLESFKKSLTKMEDEPIEERDDAYTHFFKDDGSAIKGCKLHKATGTLHIYGLVSQKKVLMPGIYTKKNKAALTRAKDKLRALTPVSRFRQFKITADKVDSIRVENLSLLPPNIED